MTLLLGSSYTALRLLRSAKLNSNPDVASFDGCREAWSGFHCMALARRLRSVEQEKGR